MFKFIRNLFGHFLEGFDRTLVVAGAAMVLVVFVIIMLLWGGSEVREQESLNLYRHGCPRLHESEWAEALKRDDCRHFNQAAVTLDRDETG